MARNWTKSYNSEISMMNLRCEAENKKAKVVTRKPTEEEQKYYNELMNKTKKSYYLTHCKGV